MDYVRALLRVVADDLDPEWVTKLLGVTSAARKGDRRPSDYLIQRVGVWTLHLPPKP